MSLKNETHRISRYKTFAKLYDINQFELFVSLYDVDEMMAFMPCNPSLQEKTALNELIGVTGGAAYLDYEKSNNTFTLMRRWQAASTSKSNRRIRMR